MPDKYIIGSHAIKSLYPNFKREPKDIDYLVKDPEVLVESNGERIEIHIVPILFDYIEKNGMTGDTLLTLKISHIFWDIKWEKHMYDIVFLFNEGCKVIKPLFQQLYEYWNFYHGKNYRSDITMNAKDFFTNALPKTHDHDFLHTLINPYPTYLKVLKDGAEVEVSEEKFNGLSFEEKLNLVREEIYVMAYERMGTRDYRVTYSWMLKKFIISHAPLWEALFILENHKHLYKPLINFKQKIDYELSRNLSKT